MSNIIRIKRRAQNGAVGAPGSLANAELAFNEADGTLYYGFGGTAGGSDSVIAIAGNGGDQTISGNRTFTGEVDLTGATVSVASAGLDAYGLIEGPTAAPASVGDVNLALVEVNEAIAALEGSTGTFVTLGTTQQIDGDKDFTGEVLVPGVGVTVGGQGPEFGGVTGSAVNREDLSAIAGLFGQAIFGLETDLSNGLNGLNEAIGDIVGGTVQVGSAEEADKLSSPVELGFTGDIGGTVSFDGSETSPISVNLTYNESALRTILGSADLDLNDNKIVGLANPTADQDAATKAYVDGVAQGLDIKESVRVSTTATDGDISLSGLQELDGVQLVAGDRVLVKNQADASENGIYIAASGAWDRADDFDGSKVTPGAFTFVEEGTKNANSGFVLTTTGSITVGSSALEFSQFSGAGQITAGDGLVKTGNTLDVGAGTGIAVDASSVGLTGQALALHNLAVDGIFVRTGAGTVAARSVVGATGSGIEVANGDGVSGDITLSLSGVLDKFNDFNAATRDNTIVGFDGTGDATLYEVGTLGVDLLGLDAGSTGEAAARDLLGLGSLAIQDADDVAITGGFIDGGSAKAFLLANAIIEDSVLDGGSF